MVCGNEDCPLSAHPIWDPKRLGIEVTASSKTLSDRGDLTSILAPEGTRESLRPAAAPWGLPTLSASQLVLDVMGKIEERRLDNRPLEPLAHDIINTVLAARLRRIAPEEKGRIAHG